MPKMKSKGAVKKRFKLTASGKVKRGHADKSHILNKKTRKRKRKLRQSALCSDPDAKRLTQMIK